MRKIREVIVVEGRYDKNALSQVVNAVILETGGFSIFNDRQKLLLLRRLAEKRGLILLTDSDGAGFVIRNYLKGSLPKDCVKQAYIPDVFGKEHRKRRAGREGKLGVEGMRPEILLRSLELAGATFEDGGNPNATVRTAITKTDFYLCGLTGKTNSAERRAVLQQSLQLPEHLSVNALLDVLNVLFSRDEFLSIFSPKEQKKFTDTKDE